MSAAPFRARYLAYTVDLALVLPVAALLAFAPLHRAGQALRALEAAALAAMERAFAEGHLTLFALADALRADALFIAALVEQTAALSVAIGWALVVVVLALAAWFIGFEASRAQATPGKRLLGLRVERLDGGRPGFGRVALRFFAAAPSWLLLHLGHAMAAWRDDGRALHDLIAGTCVAGCTQAGGATAALPIWARIWLGLQAATVLAWFGWVAWTVLRTLWLLG